MTGDASVGAYRNSTIIVVSLTLFKKAGDQCFSAFKRHGLQGPVDDAFVDSFLCVKPTGSGTKATEYGLGTLDRFQKDFAKWLRGGVRMLESDH